MTAFYFRYRLQLFITLILVFLLGLFICLAPATFLSSRIYIAYMSTIPFTAILALAITPVIISGEIDLSFPAVMATGGFVFAGLYLETGSVGLAVTAALLTGLLSGFINGLLVVKVGVPSIIATIGTQFFWRGITVLASGGLAKSLVDLRDTQLHSLFVGRISGVIPAQSVWMLLVVAVLWLLVNRYPFGDNIRFTGDNAEAAKAMGIRVGRTKIGVFCLMGFFSSFAGVLLCMEMASWWPTQGEGYMLLVFASVFVGGTSVFGGKGTVYGSFIGAVIVGIIEAGIISSGISGLWTRMVYGIIIILAVSIYATFRK
ncbi:MAG: ABC transporter permease [Desulfobacterales bacterium]|nr:ABC transporter permease [Desulfobacterales bacterium]